MSANNHSAWKPCDENEKGVHRSVIHAPRMKTLTRAQKEQVAGVKANLRRRLPALTNTGVRRYRIAHHECVLLELAEDGFLEAKNYLEGLYDHQVESETFDAEKLTGHRHLIERIKYGLINAELAKRQNENTERAIHMLETALFFQSLMPEWFWIADRFFTSAQEISMLIDDSGETLNSIKYIYGKFRFYKMKDAKGAFTLLSEAQKASKGKCWNASKILKPEPSNLFEEISLVLSEVLIELAKEMEEEDPDSAAEKIIEAIERAKDSGMQDHLAKALYAAGKIQISAGHTSEALQIFLEYLAMAEMISDPNGICDGHKELAFTYKLLKDFVRAKWHLDSFKEQAETSDLVGRLADANFHLGEFELEQGRPTSATPLLIVAFESYRNLMMQKEMDKARFLAGISKGEELKMEYLEIMKRCENDDPEALRKLLQWKQRRTPFRNP